MTSAAARLPALLLAEALRLQMAQTAAPPAADAPERLAVAARATTPEARLLAWAAAQPGAVALRERQHRLLRQTRQWLTLGLLLVAIVAGGGLGLLLAGDGPVNVSALLAGLLGWPLLMLLLWLAVRLRPAREGINQGWLAALLARLLRRLSADHGALLALVARGPFGLWLRATVLHLAWAAAFAGSVTALVFHFLFRQYDFVWQTTLLAPDTLAALLAALASGPALFGVAVPAADLPADAARRGWGLLVIACVALYGLLPRLLAALVCAGLARRALARPVLDLSQPFWVERLLAIHRAAPPAEPRGAPAPEAIGLPDAAPPRADARPVGRHVALLRLEPDALSDTHVRSDHWHLLDLGPIDSRERLRRAQADLAALPSRPARLLVVCSLLRTPDRGAVAALQRLAAAAGAPLQVLLDDAEAAAQRGLAVGDRIADWQRHAEAASAVAVQVGTLTALLAGPLPDAPP